MLLAATSVSGVAQAVALVAAALFVVLDKLGLLERMRIVRPKAADANAELDLAGRTIKRLEAENAQIRAQKVELVEGALAPVLEQLKSVAGLVGKAAELQTQTLDRLAQHNGSFKHMQESLLEIRDSLAFIAAERRPPARRRSTTT